MSAEDFDFWMMVELVTFAICGAACVILVLFSGMTLSAVPNKPPSGG